MTQGGDLHDVLTGQHVTFLETSVDTNGELLAAEVRLDPGGRVPRHAHARQDEQVEVLAGTLGLRVGGTQRAPFAVTGFAGRVVPRRGS